MTGIDPLAGLKDFQRATARHAFEQLYLADSPSRRFLIADEVGLGKTLVARGVIAQALAHLREQGTKQIDVLYVCSNLEIARQNIRRLAITDVPENAVSGRITLLPITAHLHRQNRVNFISFTPGTAVDLKSRNGLRQERQVLWMLLREIWGPQLLNRTGAFRTLQGTVADFERWRRSTRWFAKEHSKNLDPGMTEAFRRAIERADTAGTDGVGFEERFRDLCDRFAYRGPRTNADSEARLALVGDLRSLLAETCIDVLEPDLVIMDEFQRFKNLLDPEDPAGELAHRLFEYTDADTGHQARVLLLSATPYRMYVTSQDDEDHYADFIETVRFLLDDTDGLDTFRRELAAFRDGIFTAGQDGGASARRFRAAIEARLTRVMARTERLAVTADRSGMLGTADAEVTLTSEEVRQYVALARVSRTLDAGDPLDYWKSAPYLLNFMDGYEFDRRFSGDDHNDDRAEIIRDLTEAGCLLDKERLQRFEEVDAYNARLRFLRESLDAIDAWRLLWLPPSLPYYAPGSPFPASPLAHTKRLSFSSWRVAPRAAAALASYEAERSAFAHRTDDLRYADVTTKVNPLLNFAITGGADRENRLTGMPVLALLAPSPALARIGDPLEVACELNNAQGELPSVEAVIERVSDRIRRMLDDVAPPGEGGGQSDQRWYWAAPLLLDAAEDRACILEFLAPRRLSGFLDEHVPGPPVGERFEDHVDQARDAAAGDVKLGRRPDDLVEVLARLAVAAPGNCALRALRRTAPGSPPLDRLGLRDAAFLVAWGARSLFNGPEAIAIVRRADTQVPYWRQVVDYCLAGNLQAALDEFAHVLPEFHGFVAPRVEDPTFETARAMRTAMSRDPSWVEMRVIDTAGVHAPPETLRVRCHLALQLSDGRSDGSEERTKPAEVRAAFNSPFWPFVLASTSVGQEGLDFHLYSHAVIHWNLPSNPVDLEQREGRVHRYKGHAVRKNVAIAHGHVGRAVGDGEDPWQAMFDAAAASRKPTESDLVPYWVYTAPGGARIERYVPTLPWSRDRARHTQLRTALAAYRLAFGQPRQEDLVAYLERTMDEEDIVRLVDDLRIDLSPPAFGSTAGR